MPEKALTWFGTLTVMFLAMCVCLAGDPSARKKLARRQHYLHDEPLDKRLDEVYHEAIAEAHPHQRAAFEKEHARWLLKREKLKENPETYVAYVQQEIRYFARTYEEP